MTARLEVPPWLGPRQPGLRVWALEPYCGGSHRDFLQGFRRVSRHHLVEHSLPGRGWKWRMHGAALAFARLSYEESGAANGSCPGVGSGPQVLFASDMLDLATYRGLAHPAAASAPAVLYMHENQLTYPLPDGVERDLGYGFKNVTSILAADTTLFNSAYHRGEFLEALARLLEALPDASPRWALEEVKRRSRVLPVGCDLRRLDARRPAAEDAAGGAGGAARPDRWGGPERGPLILWNQRWEYDKAPGDLFRALYELKAGGTRFRLALAGANHGLPTAEFVEAHDRLADEVVQWGRVDDPGEYADLLWAADIVVSTALHEFFGVAVVEALYCGCRPVLPHRLSYPEIVPADAHGWALYQEGDLVSALSRAVGETASSRSGGCERTGGGADPETAGERASRIEWQRTWVGRYDWSAMASRYDAVIEECWEAGRDGAIDPTAGEARDRRWIGDRPGGRGVSGR